MRRRAILSVLLFVPAGLLAGVLLFMPVRAVPGPSLDVSWFVSEMPTKPDRYLYIRDIYKEYTQVSGSWQTRNNWIIRVPITYYMDRVSTEFVSWSYSLSKVSPWLYGGGVSYDYRFIVPSYTQQVALTCSVKNEDIVNDNEASSPNSASCNTSGSFSMGGSPSSFNFTSQSSGSLSAGGTLLWQPYPAPCSHAEQEKSGTITWSWSQPDPIFPGTTNLAWVDALTFSGNSSNVDSNDRDMWWQSCTLTGLTYYPIGLPMGTPTITPTLVATGTPTITATWQVTMLTPAVTPFPTSTIQFNPVISVVIPTLTLPAVTPDPVNVGIGPVTKKDCYTLLPAINVDQWILQWHIQFGVAEQRFCSQEAPVALEVLGVNWGSYIVVLTGVAGAAVLYKIVKGG